MIERPRAFGSAHEASNYIGVRAVFRHEDLERHRAAVVATRHVNLPHGATP